MAGAIDKSTAQLLRTLQSAADNWQAFGWDGQLQLQDETLLQTKEAREQSTAARKKLSDATKQFRRSVKALQQAAAALQHESSTNAQATCKASDALAKECRGIVSSYQEHIDNLTRRCKAVETAYSALAQGLAELPDPAAVLPGAAQLLQQQQAQITQLLQTVEQVSAELEQAQEENKKNQAAAAAAQSTAAAAAASTGSTGGMSKQEREELIQLRREVAEYEVEFRSLKNQDITIRKLEAKITELQTAAKEELHDQLEKAQEELAATEGRRAAEALEREAAMERKVQQLQLQLRAEKAGRQATQTAMLQADEGVSQAEAVWDAQRQILMADADRLRQDLQVTTRERDELRLENAALQGTGGSEDGGVSSSSHHSGAAPVVPAVSVDELLLERAAYQTEVSELSETNTLLREQLRLKEEALADEHRVNQNKIDTLEREKAALQTNLESLEAQLASAPSQSVIDSMKRELRILKRLEYNAGEDGLETEERGDPEIAGGHHEAEKDLESVLVSKLRRAESELINERNKRQDVCTERDSLLTTLEEVKKSKEEADKLVSNLEKDLAKAISTPKSPTRKTMPVVLSAAPENPATLQSVLDPDAPPPPPTPEAPTSTATSTTSNIPTPPVSTSSANQKAADDHSVATIVMAQRDRLRARCDALEAERDSFRRELQAQVNATESLKTDNTKLYEKMRYLQNYSKGSAPSSRAARLDRDLDLEALEQRYEASVDPFRQFSKAERQRKLNEMSPMERTVFVVAKTVLATKEMRTALFFYVVVLHMLVFVTTYHWSHADECFMMNNNEHLAHLPPNALDHVREDIGKGAAGSGP